MTTEAQYLIAATPEAFRAAIAVLSHGRRLDDATAALLRRLMEEAGLAPVEIDLLMIACQSGLRPAQADDVRFASDDEAVVFLTALTRFALRSSPNWREALFLPELIASHQRLPYDVVHRMASRVGPDLDALSADRLEANLREFLAPGPDTLAIARWISGSLHPAAPDRRSAATIPTAAFQHPLDVQAIEMVRGFAGFDELTRLIFQHGIEKMVRVAMLSSAVRVGPTQFPELYAIFQACVARAGISPEPELYVGQGGLNAETGGVERPYVMLNAGAVSMLDRAELEYIIGHELGHIRCQHMLYLFMAQWLPFIAGQLPMVGQLLGFGLRVALGEWRRKAELSCDRMGLLVSQDLEACQRVMVKLAGAPGPFHHRIDLEAFMRQGEEFRNLDQDLLSGLYKIMANMGRSHPWLVERAYELQRWVEEGGYDAAFAAAAGPEPTYLPRMPLGAGTPDTPAEAEVILTTSAPSPPRASASLDDTLDAIARTLDAAGDAPLARAVDALRRVRPAGPFHVAVVGERGRGKTTLVRRLGALEGVTLVDTPSLNDPEHRYDEAVMADAVAADAVLLVTSAMQLLSASERETLRDRLLPATNDRLAVVVTHMDAVESDEDRRDLDARARRLAERLGRPELPVFFLDGAPTDPAPAVATWLETAAEAHEPRDRAEGVLRAVLARAGGAAATPASAPEREAALALVRSRHATALAEAEADMRARLAAMRLGLPARTGPADLAGIAAHVQRIGHLAHRRYRESFARALRADAPASTLSALGSVPVGQGPAPARPLGAPEAAEASGTGHAALTTATAIGAGLLVLTGSALPVVGAIALGTAHQVRHAMDAAARARTEAEATRALDAWLAAAESQLLTELGGAAARTLSELEGRAERALEPTQPPLAGRERLRALALDALAHLATPRPQEDPS